MNKHLNNNMKTTCFICIAFIFSIGNIFAQNKIIKGRLIDENLVTLPYAYVLINDTIEVSKTNLNGFFQISIPFSVKKLSFDGIGIDLMSIEIADNCNEVEVVMMLSSTYDFKTPKKIERLRFKRFKKLPERHKEAFDKGLFKTSNACYTLEYVPLFKEIKSYINKKHLPKFNYN